MAFRFRLELADGTAATPSTFEAAVPDWRTGDSIFLGGDRILRVVERRAARSDDGVDVLVVEPVPNGH